MATGLYVLQDGTVMVAYGTRKIPIPYAQYRANGYKPSLDKLKRIPPEADKKRTPTRTASPNGWAARS
jgi:hypothetical protein